MEAIWHSLSKEKVIQVLGTSKDGLSKKEVEFRQKKYGKNLLPSKKPFTNWKIFLSQFKSPLVYILVIAGIITLFLKKFADSIVIFAAVLLNTIIGFIQEKKADQALIKLKKAIKHKTMVIREGKIKIIPAKDVVVGDIIFIKSGDKIPADGRIIYQEGLKINEMSLTGEWLASEKNTEILPFDTPLADRTNMVYMGTVVEEGIGKAVVTAIGKNTELGKITTLIQEMKEEKTPYQKNLSRLSKIIGIGLSLIIFLIFVLGISAGKKILDMFTISVALAVAAIPEGLPVAITVILALGMMRILKNKGLVKKLNSAETLGSVSIICTDKTGTLTKGKMKVSRVLSPQELLNHSFDKKAQHLCLKIASLTANIFIKNPHQPKEKWITIGRPTDKALFEAGINAGIDIEKIKKRKIKEILFNPVNKFCGIYIKEKRGIRLYLSGAPEKILEMCKYIQLKKKKKMTKEIRRKLERDLGELAKKGLRVVGTCWGSLGSGFIKEENLPETVSEIRKMNLRFTGFITLKDPIRRTVKKAISVCKKAGIKVVIITGDHKLTAKSVAEELGFKITSRNILEGKDLDKLSEEQFSKILPKIKIYARVEPRHKLRIIRALQEKGEIVAMTGDGINDAPALKKADIGIALDSGTEVAKESADLILLNNSFSTIIKGIEEGRAILDNIRKVITYLLSGSLSEVILVGASILAGLPLPITAVQILWINLIEDGLPDFALAFEPKEKDIMKKIKRSSKKTNLFFFKDRLQFLTPEMKAIIFAIGIITNLLILFIFLFFLFYNFNLRYIQTTIFAILGIDSLFYVFSLRSLRKNIWHINIFSNKFLLVSFVLGIIALLIAIYIPWFNKLLGTVPLNFSTWAIILGTGIFSLILIEIIKAYYLSQKSSS